MDDVEEEQEEEEEQEQDKEVQKEEEEEGAHVKKQLVHEPGHACHLLLHARDFGQAFLCITYSSCHHRHCIDVH